MKIGKVLRDLRKQKGLSQANVEKACRIKREYLSKLENDELDNPTIETVGKIAGALGVEVSDVFLFLEAGEIPATVADKLQRPPVDLKTLKQLEKISLSLAEVQLAVSNLYDKLKGGAVIPNA